MYAPWLVMYNDNLASLAEALIREVAGNIEVLLTLLTSDPSAEPTLTALADLALCASILERDHSASSVCLLACTIRSVLDAPILGTIGLSPGPEAWALHAARSWLDPAIERQRLHDNRIHNLLAESERVVLALGPSWRPEEVAHVAARLTGSNLPALRAVRVDSSVMSLYELAHVVFYATDFGAVMVSSPLAAELAATAMRRAEELSAAVWGYDVGVELILAARFLSGQWPPEATAWIGTLMPEWARIALTTLHEQPEQFLRLYHSMILTALAVAQTVVDRWTR